jgi:hypothetical protein
MQHINHTGRSVTTKSRFLITDNYFPVSSFCLLTSYLLRAFPQRLVVIARGRILFF